MSPPNRQPFLRQPADVVDSTKRSSCTRVMSPLRKSFAVVPTRQKIFIIFATCCGISVFCSLKYSLIDIDSWYNVMSPFQVFTERINGNVANNETHGSVLSLFSHYFGKQKNDTRQTNGIGNMSRILIDLGDTNGTLTNLKGIKKILWYIRPNYVRPSKKGELRPLKACPDVPCLETSDRSFIAQADAVIFDVHYIRHLKMFPEKHPNQVWVFYAQEPPYHIRTNLKSSMWRGVFNWTCTYRRDSDTWMPYGILEKRTRLPQKDYDKIAKKKTKMASWIVSSCNTPSKRKGYIKLLEKNGIKTDIFGGCGKEKCPRTIKGHTRCHNITTGHYSFYISFENSLCKDYITEKLFDYYNEDIILVVRGGKGNYKQYPPGIFINTEDFKNVTELASYMKELHNNKTKYVEFLKRKDAYKAVTETFNYKLSKTSEYTHHHYLSEPMCDMCRKLLKGESKPHVYKDIYSWFHGGACERPLDLK